MRPTLCYFLNKKNEVLVQRIMSLIKFENNILGGVGPLRSPRFFFKSRFKAGSQSPSLRVSEIHELFFKSRFKAGSQSPSLEV